MRLINREGFPPRDGVDAIHYWRQAIKEPTGYRHQYEPEPVLNVGSRTPARPRNLNVGECLYFFRGKGSPRLGIRIEDPLHPGFLSLMRYRFAYWGELQQAWFVPLPTSPRWMIHGVLDIASEMECLSVLKTDNIPLYWASLRKGGWSHVLETFGEFIDLGDSKTERWLAHSLPRRWISASKDQWRTSNNAIRHECTPYEQELGFYDRQGSIEERMIEAGKRRWKLDTLNLASIDRLPTKKRAALQTWAEEDKRLYSTEAYQSIRSLYNSAINLHRGDDPSFVEVK
jgi:hypothetical protein